MTPEQMRALANEHLESSPAIDTKMIAALRAAADQLEAVRKLASARASTAREVRDRGNERSWNDVLALLTADTAPQETHNGVPVFRDAKGRAWFGCSLEPIKPDTAPQDGRDAVYSGSVRSALFECAAVFPGDLLGPVTYCRKRRGHTGEHNADGMRWLR